MSLIDRAKNIITSPKSEWVTIEGEQPDVGQIVTTYVLPLAGLAAVASLIGWTVFGMPIPFFGSIKGLNFGLMYAIQSLIQTIASVFLTAFVVDLLAPSFQSEKNFGRAVQLVAYSFTPSWLGGIFNIYPAIGWLGGLFGLYGIYLMYLGFPSTMKTPQEKVVVYMIVAVLILIVVYFILAAILGAILGGIFGLSLLGSMR
jgi:hypothetical protein